MEGLAVLLILFLIAIVVMPIVAVVKAAGARRRVEDLSSRLDLLENSVRRLQSRAKGETQPEREAEPATQPRAEFAQRAAQPSPIITAEEPPPPIVPPLPQVAKTHVPEIPVPPAKQAAEPVRAPVV